MVKLKLGLFVAGLLMCFACQGEDDGAAGGGDCAVGSEGCACTSGGGCDSGLSCLSRLCVSPDPNARDSNDSGAGDGGSQDAQSSGDGSSDGAAVGTVVNSELDLTWMKCCQGMTYNAATDSCEGECGQFKYCTSPDNSCNGGSDGGILDSGPAYDTCDGLNTDDQSGWRVPTIYELISLIKCTDGKIVPAPDGSDVERECGDGNYTSPTIDTSEFPDFPSRVFWSSSSTSGSRRAWNVNFNFGLVNYFNKYHYKLAVVCVR